MLTGSAIAGFAFAAILFGLAHLYQGWKGIAATFVLGLAMTAIYLFTQSLLAAIVFHAIVDLNALVVAAAVGAAAPLRAREVWRAVACVIHALCSLALRRMTVRDSIGESADVRAASNRSW